MMSARHAGAFLTHVVCEGAQTQTRAAARLTAVVPTSHGLTRTAAAASHTGRTKPVAADVYPRYMGITADRWELQLRIPTIRRRAMVHIRAQ